MDIRQQLRGELLAAADPKYQRFISSLTPGAGEIIGVRMPKLRKLASRLLKDDWRAFVVVEDACFEELMLQALIIGRVKTEWEECCSLISSFVPKITNWAVCDTLCSSLKIARRYPEQMWQFLQPYLQDSREFHIRFGVVMLLDHFVDQQHIRSVLQAVDRTKHDDYYAMMAVAWAVSACYIRFPEITMEYLRVNHLHKTAFNKSIQKICESSQVDAAEKQKLRLLKKI